MKSDLSHLYEKRCLVFLETTPQSNKYRQIIFKANEYPRMTKTLGTLVSKEGNIETYEIEESDEIYNLPDLRSHL